jgi:hypothetical protein
MLRDSELRPMCLQSRQTQQVGTADGTMVNVVRGSFPWVTKQQRRTIDRRQLSSLLRPPTY